MDRYPGRGHDAGCPVGGVSLPIALTPNDAPRLAELAAKLLPEAWSAEAIRQILASGEASGWKIEQASHLAAFLLLRHLGEEMELLCLCVDPALQRRGLASDLIRQSKAPLPPGASIFLEVRAGNAVAIGFYEKHGFERCGLRKAYYTPPLPAEDAVVMRWGA